MIKYAIIGLGIGAIGGTAGTLLGYALCCVYDWMIKKKDIDEK